MHHRALPWCFWQHAAKYLKLEQNLLMIRGNFPSGAQAIMDHFHTPFAPFFHGAL